MNEEDYVAILANRLATDGVAIANVKDGTILMLSKEKLLEFLKTVEDKKGRQADRLHQTWSDCWRPGSF